MSRSADAVTAAQLAQPPYTQRSCELVDGAVVDVSAASWRHGVVAGRIMRALILQIEARGGFAAAPLDAMLAAPVAARPRVIVGATRFADPRASLLNLLILVGGGFIAAWSLLGWVSILGSTPHWRGKAITSGIVAVTIAVFLFASRKRRNAAQHPVRQVRRRDHDR